MHLKPRAFVERLDFVTSPGHLGGGDSRRKLGLPGQGPAQVITDKALFDFENAAREMQLISLHPACDGESALQLAGGAMPPENERRPRYGRRAALSGRVGS